MNEQLHLALILGDVETERERQDKEWGGAAHDDGHTIEDWREQIEKHRELAHNELAKGDAADYGIVRDRLIKVAALSAAAMQSQERIRYGQITKDNSSFEEWFNQVKEFGIIHGLFKSDSTISVETWRNDYDNGETPLSAVHEDFSSM
jgi:hypothetical protein